MRVFVRCLDHGSEVLKISNDAIIKETQRPSFGEGHDNPLQYSGLENPMGRGAWQATVHEVTKSQIHLKTLSTHSKT